MRSRCDHEECGIEVTGADAARFVAERQANDNRNVMQPYYVELMANTYTSLLYHIVFSTKNRERWIAPNIEERVWAYLGGIMRENQVTPFQIGGIEDHVHLLLRAPPSVAPSKIAQIVKSGTSAWIHSTFPMLKGFAWQDGYGAFTVSESNAESVAGYIRSQREHHRHKTFQEEYRAFLQKHGVKYDEKYLWD